MHIKICIIVRLIAISSVPGWHFLAWTQWMVCARSKWQDDSEYKFFSSIFKINRKANIVVVILNWLQHILICTYSNALWPGPPRGGATGAICLVALAQEGTPNYIGLLNLQKIDSNGMWNFSIGPQYSLFCPVPPYIRQTNIIFNFTCISTSKSMLRAGHSFYFGTSKRVLILTEGIFDKSIWICKERVFMQIITI